MCVLKPEKKCMYKCMYMYNYILKKHTSTQK